VAKVLVLRALQNANADKVAKQLNFTKQISKVASREVKRSEVCMARSRFEANREMVGDFIESGQPLTDKLKKLLKACESPMLKARGRNDGTLGKNAGIKFVDAIFGLDRQLESTEKLMASIRL
jgi:hypothetical protein